MTQIPNLLAHSMGVKPKKQNSTRKTAFILFAMAYIVMSLICFVRLYSVETRMSSSQETYQNLYELVLSQDSLIEVQGVVLELLTNHMWYNHDCDLPICDGDDYMEMERLRHKVSDLFDCK